VCGSNTLYHPCRARLSHRPGNTTGGSHTTRGITTPPDNNRTSRPEKKKNQKKIVALTRSPATAQTKRTTLFQLNDNRRNSNTQDSLNQETTAEAQLTRDTTQITRQISLQMNRHNPIN
jgi:hypothetical protein